MDAIMGIINSNIVVLGFLWGLAVKYLPVLKWLPNKFIPYTVTILATLAKITGPPEAQAATDVAIQASLFGGLFHFLGPVLGAGWSAVQSALIYEVFARHPLEAAGVKKVV